MPENELCRYLELEASGYILKFYKNSPIKLSEIKRFYKDWSFFDAGEIGEYIADYFVSKNNNDEFIF